MKSPQDYNKKQNTAKQKKKQIEDKTNCQFPRWRSVNDTPAKTPAALVHKEARNTPYPIEKINQCVYFWRYVHFFPTKSHPKSSKDSTIPKSPIWDKNMKFIYWYLLYAIEVILNSIIRQTCHIWAPFFLDYILASFFFLDVLVWFYMAYSIL